VYLFTLFDPEGRKIQIHAGMNELFQHKQFWNFSCYQWVHHILLILLAEKNSQSSGIYFQFCFLCSEFRKIGSLHNIL